MRTAKGNLILVLGGARSGKSSFAHSRALDLEKSRGLRVFYFAAAAAGDEEMRRRIEAHRAGRPASWTTVEEPRRISAAIGERCDASSAAVIDCLTLLVSNIVAERCTAGPEAQTVPPEEEAAAGAAVDAEVEAIVAAVRGTGCTAIIVSNEVGLGVVPPSPLGRLFQDVAGRAHQRLAREADEAYFMVAGIPQRIK